MSHLELQQKKDLSAFRRIAIGTWRTAYDPSVYGTMELRMDRATEYIERYRKATGKRLTVTHMVARAVGEALAQMPDANAILRFNKIYLRKRIGVFMQVSMTDEGDDKVDLSGVTIYDPEQKSLTQMVDETQEKVDRVRKRDDPHLEQSRNLFHRIPALLLGVFLRLISFVLFTLNIDPKRFGMPRDPFGSIMITNIGSLGLDVAYVPLVPYSRVPILLALGAVKEQPVVDAGQLTVGKVMKVNATFDHRFIDGYHAAVMSRTMRQWLEDPDTHFGPPTAPRVPEPAHDPISSPRA